MSLDTCTAAAEGGGTSTSSSLLLYDCHKSVPAPFLTKTYHLVNDPATDYIVSWKDSDTSSFVVWRPPEFARDLLPIYFKHSNFSSFVRQLNTYGFKKLVPYRWEFGNDFFRRGQIHLLSRIHRRKSVPPAPASSGKSIPAAAPHHRRTVNSASNPPRAAQLQQQNHSWSVLSTTTTTPLSSSSPRPAIILDPPAVHDHNVVVGHGRAFISDETEKLRKDNTLLHSENSRLRRLLYDYKQQLAAAASPQQQQACLSR
jgi:heat shock transcription factor